MLSHQKIAPGSVGFYDEDLSTFVSAILQEEEVRREKERGKGKLLQLPTL